MLKKSLFCILLYLLNFTAFAQQGTKDLDSLYTLLTKMPSFKEQITGEKAIQYEQLYAKLKKEITPDLTDHQRFRKLSELILPINDNHIDFNQVAINVFTMDKRSDPVFIKTYKESAAYKKFPRSNKDLVKLEKELAKKDTQDIEGIYYNYGDQIKIGIYKTAVKGQLEGVVLFSKAMHWEPGEIMLYLQEKGNNYYNIWNNDFGSKTLFLCKGERFDNGSLLWSGFRKHPEIKTFVNISHDPVFQLKQIDSTTQYLKLSSFNAIDANKLAAKNFYNSIKDSITAPNLIVDVRNNGGGYYSVSSQFLNLIRRYVNPGKVYVLINYHTVSNGEQFAIKLKAVPNVLLLGQQTWGRISYGQNYGTNYVLPGGKFEIIPTDLPSEKIDLAYEGIGVKPDVILDPSKDWIEQVKAIIKNNK